MLLPFISSKYSTSRKRVTDLERRKGGGGGGGGGRSGGGTTGGRTGSTGSSGRGGTGGSSGSTSGRPGSSTGNSGGGRPSSNGGGSTGSGSSRSSPISISGSNGRTASPSSNGGGPSTSIPSGSLFSGRNQGGGTRSQVYGTSSYGSGYPGFTGRGVSNRGFPFYYWPLTWGAAAGIGGATYYHNADSEYGLPGNSSRPGGSMTFATFVSNSQNTTFHVVADNATVSDLMTDIYSHCSSSINNSSSTTSRPVPFNDSDPSAPSAQSVIQYYRASSVALVLDGYNNSATWANATDNTPNTPLPTNIDTTLQGCLNQTIGDSVPLVNAVDSSNSGSSGNPCASQDCVDFSSASRLSSVDMRSIALIFVGLHLIGVLS